MLPTVLKNFLLKYNWFQDYKREKNMNSLSVKFLRASNLRIWCNSAFWRSSSSFLITRVASKFLHFVFRVSTSAVWFLYFLPSSINFVLVDSVDFSTVFCEFNFSCDNLRNFSSACSNACRKHSFSAVKSCHMIIVWTRYIKLIDKLQDKDKINIIYL